MKPTGGGSTTVTAKEVKTRLEKPNTLTSEEEKVLRMRHGAGAPSKSAALPRAAGGNEQLGDELLLIEMQLLKASRQRTAAPAKAASKARAPAPAAPARPSGAGNQTKDKIVRALRKKQR
jgi:hypothetical protein